MSLQPRAAEGLDHARLFDKGCVESRLRELTHAFIDKFTKEEMEKIADEARRAFKPIPDFQWLDQIKFEKYGEQARKEAEQVLEQERQNYVNFMTLYITNSLLQIAKHLYNLVVTVDEHDKLVKVTIFRERKVGPDNRGVVREYDEEYVLDHDVWRLEQINLWRQRLTEFKDYAPYFSDKIVKDAWNSLLELSNLEVVEVKANAKT